MSSESLHEADEALSTETKDMHRAIVSLKEELDAVDWYQQRAEASSDADLRAVLIHNKNEEIEHAMMVLEWIRRHSEVFDDHIATYLRTKGPITEIEKAQSEAKSEGGVGAAKGGAHGGRSPSLGIGSLKGGK